MVHGRWSMVDGQWSMVHGPWSMVDGPWSVMRSVLRRPFHLVDDEHLDRGFRAFELQAELLLDGRKETWRRVHVGRWRRHRVRPDRCCTASAPRPTALAFEMMRTMRSSFLGFSVPCHVPVMVCACTKFPVTIQTATIQRISDFMEGSLLAHSLSLPACGMNNPTSGRKHFTAPRRLIRSTNANSHDPRFEVRE